MTRDLWPSIRLCSLQFFPSKKYGSLWIYIQCVLVVHVSSRVESIYDTCSNLLRNPISLWCRIFKTLSQTFVLTIIIVRQIFVINICHAGKFCQNILYTFSQKRIYLFKRNDSFKHKCNKTFSQAWNYIIEFKRDMKTPDVSIRPLYCQSL